MSVAAAEALLLAREESRRAAEKAGQARPADDSPEPAPPKSKPPDGDSR